MHQLLAPSVGRARPELKRASRTRTRVARIVQAEFGRLALVELDGALATQASPRGLFMMRLGGARAHVRLDPIECEQVVHLDVGAVVRVNPWQGFVYEQTTKSDAPTVLLTLSVEPECFGDLGITPSGSTRARPFRTPQEDLTPSASKLAREVALRILMQEPLTSRVWQVQLRQLVSALSEDAIGRMESSESRSRNVSGAIDPRVRMALRILSNGNGTIRNVEELARRCRLSRTHFFALFRAGTGLTPVLYANGLRLERAIGKIGGTELPIAEIARSAGFSTPGHFTRFFRAQTGLSPSQFRRAAENLSDSQAERAARDQRPAPAARHEASP